MTVFKQIHREISLTVLYFRDFFGGGVSQVYDNMSLAEEPRYCTTTAYYKNSNGLESTRSLPQFHYKSTPSVGLSIWSKTFEAFFR